MMNKNIINIILFSCILFLAGCKKFLDVSPSTESVNPLKIKDFQEMLNNDSLSVGNYFLLDLASDDVYLPNTVLKGVDNYYLRTYLWKVTIWNPADVDYMYNSAYTRILQMNIILSRVNTAPADSLNTIENRSNVISQSLINRAWFYLQLANIYGVAYNTATAAKDLAVPLVLLPDASAKPARASVKDVYYQVIGDLKSAVNNPYLPSQGQDIIHPGKAAAYALLSRAYLYMANYDSASVYADSSLALVSALQNYRSGYSAPTQLLDLKTNPEILLGKVSYEQNFFSTYSSSIQLSSSLTPYMSYFDYRYFYRFNGYNYKTTTYNSITTIFTDNSVGVPEVMLTKAECLARKGDADGAAVLINNISSNRQRFYSPITDYDASNILDFVLAERRRELFYHGGMRLFDLKRLNMEDKYKLDLVRKDDDSTVIATLPAGSSRYIFPFPQTVLSNNPNIVQNVRE